MTNYIIFKWILTENFNQDFIQELFVNCVSVEVIMLCYIRFFWIINSEIFMMHFTYFLLRYSYKFTFSVMTPWNLRFDPPICISLKSSFAIMTLIVLFNSFEKTNITSLLIVTHCQGYYRFFKSLLQFRSIVSFFG